MNPRRFNLHIEKSLQLKDYKIQLRQCEKFLNFILNCTCDFSSGLSVRFCDSVEMKSQNLLFRKKNKSTDVLSFPSPPGTFDDASLYLGDILVCLPVCAQQAKARRITLTKEVARMLCHSVVHLKGFDHERGEGAARIMKRLEDSLLKEASSHLEGEWVQYLGA